MTVAKALIVGSATLAMLQGGAAAAVCVSPGGTGGCHPSVQAAVDAATDGETVHVFAGTYPEPVLIPAGGIGAGRTLTIEGDGTGATVVQGVIRIARQSRIRLQDLTVATTGIGVLIESGSEVTIERCEVSGQTATAIDVIRGTADIVDSTVSDSPTGIRVVNAHVSVRGSTLSGNGTGLLADNQPGNRGPFVVLSTSLVADNALGMRLARTHATITDSTIRGNSAGGIAVFAGTRLTLARSTVAENSNTPGLGLAGGGILVDAGLVRLENSTVSGNQAGAGAGVYVRRHGRLFLLSSTVSGNAASASGGGISVDGGLVRLTNSLLAGNTAPSGADCTGRLRSGGFNLVGAVEPGVCEVRGSPRGNQIGIGPLLAPLAANGGPTETHALLPGSPAIDAGNPVTPTGRGKACPSRDQRGVDRVPTAPCDIGAYESP